MLRPDALPAKARSLLAWAGHLFLIRLVLVALVLAIIAVSIRQTGFTSANLFLLVFGALYPHACRLIFDRPGRRRRRANASLLVDGFFAGAVIPAIGFATLPSLVLLVINLANWIAIGGPLLSAFGIFTLLIGLVLSGTFSRYAYGLELQDPAIDLLAYALLLSYFLLVSWVVYRHAAGLERRCAELQAQRHAAENAMRRAERALLAVLPPTAAQELQARGSVAPRRLTDATLLLVDCGALPFEALAERFTICDEIFTRHGLYRIKTSHRRLLAQAAGTPPVATAAALAAATELLRYLDEHDGDYCHTDKQTHTGDPPLRVFIHCGAVEMGLVQADQLNFDAVGDAIDTLHALAYRDWPARLLITANAAAHLNPQTHPHPPLQPAGEHAGLSLLTPTSS